MMKFLKKFKNKLIEVFRKGFNKLRKKLAKFINLIGFKFRDKFEKLFSWLRLYPDQVNFDRISFYVEEMMGELHNAGYRLVYTSLDNGKPSVRVMKSNHAKKYVADNFTNTTIMDVEMIMDKFVDKGDVYYPYLINKEHKDMYFLDDEFFHTLELNFGVKNDFSPFNEEYVKKYREGLLETEDSRSWLPENPKSKNDEL